MIMVLVVKLAFAGVVIPVLIGDFVRPADVVLPGELVADHRARDPADDGARFLVPAIASNCGADRSPGEGAKDGAGRLSFGLLFLASRSRVGHRWDGEDGD